MNYDRTLTSYFGADGRCHLIARNVIIVGGQSDESTTLQQGDAVPVPGSRSRFKLNSELINVKSQGNITLAVQGRATPSRCFPTHDRVLGVDIRKLKTQTKITTYLLLAVILLAFPAPPKPNFLSRA
ncbi:hypothetical protein Agabi119p4_7855 [Agaricus bisporus var. burnettii]|uniref:Uncharacterized protein n=1 Tax=Agaricus bisporus var. burnettii TaxID=192524 RepID=A0A8H7C7W5_AGABI|nr:hypothetical protein Agabi119p4_7855 [Agaricus bisporus var. burnettii]